jgi:integrase
LRTSLDTSEKNFLKRTTYISYEGYINNYYIKLDVPIEDITTAQLQDFFNEKLELGLSVKTVRNMFIMLKKALNRAVIDKLIPENPARYVELPKIQKKEIKVLTQEQQEKLISVSYLHRYGPFIRLTLCTGLRLGELLGLKWEDIDFRKSELHIRRILHRCKNYDPNVKTSTSIFFDEPKTQRSKRIIPLPENAISDLKKWKEKQEEEVGNVEFVVTDERGKYLEQSTLKKYYNRMLDECGIKHMTFHALRHTFATRALEKGMDIKVLSEILGHYSVAFTLDTYAHVLDKFKRENMELMNDVYSRSPQRQKIVLSFKKFREQFIVSIPFHQQYTFIAQNIQDGIDYVKSKMDQIHLTHPIDIDKCLLSKGKDEILVFLG